MKNLFSLFLLAFLTLGFVACDNDSVANEEKVYIDSPDGDDLPEIETDSPDGDDLPEIEDLDSPDGDDLPEIEDLDSPDGDDLPEIED